MYLYYNFIWLHDWIEPIFSCSIRDIKISTSMGLNGAPKGTPEFCNKNGDHTGNILTKTESMHLRIQYFLLD